MAFMLKTWSLQLITHIVYVLGKYIYCIYLIFEIGLKITELIYKH